MRLSRHFLAASTVAASLAITAAPALAQGGSGTGGSGSGGGGTTSTTTTTVDASWTLCPEYANGPVVQADGSILFANEIGGIGCLVAKSSAGSLSIYDVRAGTGWVATIKSSDPSKLDVQFTKPSTGEKHEIIVQPGKTVMR